MAQGKYGPIDPGKYPQVGPNYMKYGDRPGWIYVPYQDKYVPDPKAQKEYYESAGLIEPTPEPPGLLESLAPVAGTAAAMYGTQALIPELIGSFGSGTEAGSGLLGNLGGVFGAETPAVASTASSSGAEAALNAFGGVGDAAYGPSEAVEGLFGGGTEGGGTLGNIAGSATPYLGAAGTALGAYGMYEGIKNKDPLSAGMSGLGTWGGLNMMGYGLGPWGWAIPAGAVALSLLGDPFDQKSTIEYQNERTDKLREMGIPESYLQGRSADIAAREAGGGVLPVPDWQQGLITEKGHLTPEGMKDAASLWGTSGMLETFGPEYLNNWSEQDRYAVTQEAINQGLFDPNKGDWDITDPNALKAAADAAKQNEDYIAKYQAWLQANR